MSSRIDGDLDHRAKRRFDRHVAGCRRCALVLTSLRHTLRLLREAGEEVAVLPGSVAVDVLGRIHREPDTGGER